MFKNRWVVLYLVILGLILRVPYWSLWLEDWDSVQFALALHNFSLVDQEPHPPGYPLYIFLGRILNIFIQNDTVTLVFLSIVLGAATIIPLYYLMKNMNIGAKTATTVLILFIVTPIHWILSEVALTNIPGMFFTVFSAFFLYKGIQSPRLLYIGSFLSGLTLGVRFAEYSILFALLALVLLWRKNLLDVFRVSFFWFAGISVWLIPLIVDTGFTSFITLYQIQIAYIVQHDSIAAYQTFLERIREIFKLLEMAYTIWYLPVVVIILSFLIKKRVAIHNKAFIFALVWLLAYAIPLVFVYNLEVPRHVLPLLPSTVILLALAIENFTHKIALYALLAVCILFIFMKGLNLVQRQHILIPPTIQPVLYVKDHFDPTKTILITTFTYRQFQYYAPEFLNYYDAKSVPGTITTPTVIIDYEGIKDKIPALAHYQIAETKVFSGPTEIFPRLPQTTLFILKK